MPTPRETALQALLAALQTMSGATALRGTILPERIPPNGLLILRDGDPGTPEITLSPLQYHFEHRAEIEVIVQGKTPADRDTALDGLLHALSTIGRFGPFTSVDDKGTLRPTRGLESRQINALRSRRNVSVKTRIQNLSHRTSRAQLLLQHGLSFAVFHSLLNLRIS